MQGSRLAQRADQQVALPRALRHLWGPVRLVALARHVWESGTNADVFLDSPHTDLNGYGSLEAATSHRTLLESTVPQGNNQ
jgi:hypothetical protein